MERREDVSIITIKNRLSVVSHYLTLHFSLFSLRRLSLLHATVTITMTSYLIAGASRGFGLALARELVSRPATEVGKVIASARGGPPDFDEFAKSSYGRVVVVKLDVTNRESVKQAAAEVEAKLEGKGLDVLINNAGVCQYVADGVESMYLPLI